MRLDARDLSGPVLNWAALKSIGIEVFGEVAVPHLGRRDVTERLQAWLVNEKKISLRFEEYRARDTAWRSHLHCGLVKASGASAHEAALRCWVLHALGEQVEIPDEIVQAFSRPAQATDSPGTPPLPERQRA